MRNQDELNRVMELYGDSIRRICFLHLKNYSDVEDVFQEVFLKYILHNGDFESDAHEKAWLIRVAINACKDILKSFFRSKVSSLEEAYTEPFYMDDDASEVMDAVLHLQDKYRNVIYLFYYEGYSAVEIAKILHKKVNTIYTWLSRAKDQLRNTFGGENLEE